MTGRAGREQTLSQCQLLPATWGGQILLFLGMVWIPYFSFVSILEAVHYINLGLCCDGNVGTVMNGSLLVRDKNVFKVEI